MDLVPTLSYVVAAPYGAYHLMVGSGGIKMREVEAVNDLDKQFEPQFMSSGQPMADRVTQTAEGPVRTIAILGD